MSTNLDTSKRSAARAKGLRLAARVATVGGFAVAALGLAEARAAHASGSPTDVVKVSADSDSANDDVRPLPLERTGALSRGGNCGCSPCWGPPAPPPSRDA